MKWKQKIRNKPNRPKILYSFTLGMRKTHPTSLAEEPLLGVFMGLDRSDVIDLRFFSGPTRPN